jgi:hypothetical protein
MIESCCSSNGGVKGRRLFPFVLILLPLFGIGGFGGYWIWTLVHKFNKRGLVSFSESESRNPAFFLFLQSFQEFDPRRFPEHIPADWPIGSAIQVRPQNPLKS